MYLQAKTTFGDATNKARTWGKNAEEVRLGRAEVVVVVFMAGMALLLLHDPQFQRRTALCCSTRSQTFLGLAFATTNCLEVMLGAFKTSEIRAFSTARCSVSLLAMIWPDTCWQDAGSTSLRLHLKDAAALETVL